MTKELKNGRKFHKGEFLGTILELWSTYDLKLPLQIFGAIMFSKPSVFETFN